MAIVIIDEACRRHGDRHCRRAECELRLSYERERVEALLVAKWNNRTMDREEQIAPDMAWRKGSGTDVKRSTDIWAERIDIDRAWKRAELKPEVRSIVWEHYGNGVSQKAIAITLGVSQQTVSLRLHRAVGEVMFQLNGRQPAELTEEEE